MPRFPVAAGAVQNQVDRLAPILSPEGPAAGCRGHLSSGLAEFDRRGKSIGGEIAGAPAAGVCDIQVSGDWELDPYFRAGI
jgi:hypothetical protein